MTPQELLAKAAEVMSERGKATGTYESNGDFAEDFGAKGSVCAYGAMTRAATEGQTSAYSELGWLYDGAWFERKGLIDQAAVLLTQHADLDGAPFNTAFSKVTYWSDKSSTEDVILTMKKAAHG